jgi:hypothetical protein
MAAAAIRHMAFAGGYARRARSGSTLLSPRGLRHRRGAHEPGGGQRDLGHETALHGGDPGDDEIPDLGRRHVAEIQVVGPELVVPVGRYGHRRSRWPKRRGSSGELPDA